MEETTRIFFREQLQDPDNQCCVDSGAANPQWASVSHGCYISLESSGVHRSLGVHISFVRSTTMDSWKPLQLRLMELGGNQRLRAFFRQHNISDNTPIRQKYSTRAAEWYRRNLRALAEGSEPPPPLPEGTGHLPAATAVPSVPVPLSGAIAGGLISAGGALGSDARHYATDGYHGDSPIKSQMSPRRKTMDGFGSDGPMAAYSTQDDPGILSGLLGPDAGEKVSTGVWTAVGMVGSLAGKAKAVAESKAAQAQEEGWLDTALDAARQGVDAAVEAGKATYNFVQDGSGNHQEVLGSTAKKSMSLATSGVDWIGEQISGLTQDTKTAAGLQSMSSGTMQGFGSDCPAMVAKRQDEVIDVWNDKDWGDPAPRKNVDIWNDKDFGDWN
mmetsp:Transcript_15361/g.30242  ORF Transcript_15361/g.30242 Transcript_15361/m.30242 type:complete len:386 (+) Transcript_15361:81-1238(+)